MFFILMLSIINHIRCKWKYCQVQLIPAERYDDNIVIAIKKKKDIIISFNLK